MLESIASRIWYTIYLTPFVSVVLLLYIFNSTSPETIGPFGILTVFILLYLFWASIFFICIHFSFALIKNTAMFQKMLARRENKPFNWRMSYYVASIIAFMPVLLLAMQSVNQLSIRDVILVLLFVVLAIFYVVKRV